VIQDVLYRSSILAPDMSRPTVDSIPTTDKKAFAQDMCNLRRKSLDAAYKTAEGKAAIEPFLVGQNLASPNFMTMDAVTVQSAFIGASEIIKAQTDGRATLKTRDFGAMRNMVSDMNKSAKDFWKGGK